MRFASFLLALPLAVMGSPAETVEKRQVAKILPALKTVNTDVNNLNKRLNQIPDNAAPTGQDQIQLLNLSTKLKDDLNAADDIVDASPKANKKQSTQIFNYIQKTLLPSTQTVLQNFIDHTGIRNSAARGIVRGQLDQQKAIVDDLSKSLVAKSTGIPKAKTDALIKSFNDAFAAAIAAYA